MHRTRAGQELNDGNQQVQLESTRVTPQHCIIDLGEHVARSRHLLGIQTARVQPVRRLPVATIIIFPPNKTYRRCSPPPADGADLLEMNGCQNEESRLTLSG